MVCHVWPGITPMNVWDMPYDAWTLFATAADEWVKNRKDTADGR